MISKYVAPAFKEKAFHCPHCNVYAHQSWDNLRRAGGRPPGDVPYLSISVCCSCDRYAVWVGNKMAYPMRSVAPFASEDMPEDVKADYNEARRIMLLSPRSSAALLRLAVQKLMQHLGEKGRNLNVDIANLVSKGLPAKVQKAFDTVRVIGNNAVHPGNIDIKDDSTTAGRLFELLNFVVDFEITAVKKIDEIYDDKITDNQKEQIRKRDEENE